MNARQFFDVWATVVELVSHARTYPRDASSYRGEAVRHATHHHGPEAGEAAEAYFDRLQADARTGNMKR